MAIGKGKLERLSGMFPHPQPDGNVILTGDISPYNERTGRLIRDMCKWFQEDGARFVLRPVPTRKRGKGPSHALYIEPMEPRPSKSQSIIDECEEAMVQEVKLRLQNRN